MILCIITIPFFSSLAILLFGRYIGEKGGEIISKISIMISMIIGIIILSRNIKNNEEIIIRIFEWINIGMMKIGVNMIIDKYTILMIFLITTITFVVITYSTWYMKDDPHKNRFLSIILMFAVTMLLFVSSSNLLIMFIGWEGVGIMSFLLINFWYYSLNSNKSAIKAILYNKLGDIGLLIAISLIIIISYNSSLTNIIFIGENINNKEKEIILFLILIVFIIAAMAKSAQFFFHPWLGDAMAGPTPVSALLHAATMVTAGVYLLIRIEGLIKISETIRIIIIIIGLFTIIIGGLSSINQYDIKKIIAYSTCSQLGYMFLTNGLLIPSIGFFHLLTHGFFKAMLFITAGIIIHNNKNEQDIRKYGSFVLRYPLSFFLFLLGSFSILSFPFLSGFYSKEAIIFSSLAPQYPIYIYIIMIIGGLITSIYSYKLIYYTYYSKPNSLNYSIFYNNNFNNNFNNFSHNEFPLSFFNILIMSILIIGSIFFGYLSKEYLTTILLVSDNEFFPLYLQLLPLFFSFIGIILGFIRINPWKNKYILTIMNHRFFFDNIFNYFFSSFFLNFGYIFSFKLLDRGLFEFLGPIGLLRIIYTIPKKIKKEKEDLSILISYLFFTFFTFIFFFLYFFISFF